MGDFTFIGVHLPALRLFLVNAVKSAVSSEKKLSFLFVGEHLDCITIIQGIHKVLATF